MKSTESYVQALQTIVIILSVGFVVVVVLFVFFFEFVSLRDLAAENLSEIGDNMYTF